MCVSALMGAGVVAVYLTGLGSVLDEGQVLYAQDEYFELGLGGSAFSPQLHLVGL